MNQIWQAFMKCLEEQEMRLSEELVDEDMMRIQELQAQVKLLRDIILLVYEVLCSRSQTDELARLKE